MVSRAEQLVQHTHAQMGKTIPIQTARDLSKWKTYFFIENSPAANKELS